VRLKSADISMVECRSHVPARLHRQVKGDGHLEPEGLTGNLISTLDASAVDSATPLFTASAIHQRPTNPPRKGPDVPAHSRLGS